MVISSTPKILSRRMRAVGWLRLGAWIAAIAILSTGCTRNAVAIETRKLSRPNPTTYDFDYSVSELHDKALSAFAMERQVKEPIFGKARNPGYLATAILIVGNSKDAIDGDLLSRPENRADLYLNRFHVPLWESPVYRGTQGGLIFTADFHLHLSPVNERRTAVSVTALRTEVFNGEAFGLGHGIGWFTVHVAVPPTSVEEYTILRYLGRALGIQNMPAVVLPPS